MEELEKLKEENERLKVVIRSLRKELELYKKQSRRRFDADADFVPHPEEDRD
jgi:hypothetical protein